MNQFTESFKENFRKIYGNRCDSLLETGDSHILRIITHDMNEEITEQQIMDAVTLGEIQDRIRNRRAKRDLYIQFWEK